MSAWLCGKTVGVWSWWRSSRSLPLSLDWGWRKFTLLFILILTEATSKCLKKFAEVIEFAEDNWTLIFRHSFSCWLGFPNYLPGEKQPKTSISHSCKEKVFVMTKFDMWISENSRTWQSLKNQSLILTWLGLIYSTNPLHLILTACFILLAQTQGQFS